MQSTQLNSSSLEQTVHWAKRHSEVLKTDQFKSMWRMDSERYLLPTIDVW